MAKLTASVGVGIMIASLLLAGPAVAQSSSASRCATLFNTGLVNLVCATVSVNVGPLHNCQPSQGIDVKCAYEVTFSGTASGLTGGSASFQFGCLGSWISPFPNPDPCLTNPHPCNWGAGGSCSVSAGPVTYWLNAADGTIQVDCHDSFVSASARLAGLNVAGVTVDSGEACTPPVQG